MHGTLLHACDKNDLKISAKKTEAMYQPVTPGKPCNVLNGQRLQIVDYYTYLGSSLSRPVPIDEEVNARIATTSVAFGRLRGHVKAGLRARLGTPVKLV